MSSRAMLRSSEPSARNVARRRLLATHDGDINRSVTRKQLLLQKTRSSLQTLLNRARGGNACCLPRGVSLTTEQQLWRFETWEEVDGTKKEEHHVPTLSRPGFKVQWLRFPSFAETIVRMNYLWFR